MQTDTSSELERFAAEYEGSPPWEIGRPQPPFVVVADQVISPVLDAGCGTGATALFFAGLGREVTGIDFVEEAIRRARDKAARAGIDAEFLVLDAMTLESWDRRFASVIDSGLFHIYSGEKRARYVLGLAHVLRPGGRLFLFGFSNEEPAAPRGGVSEEEIRSSFAEGWEIESMQSVRGELNPAFTAAFPDEFPKEGPLMRFAVIRRKA